MLIVFALQTRTVSFHDIYFSLLLKPARAGLPFSPNEIFDFSGVRYLFVAPLEYIKNVRENLQVVLDSLELVLLWKVGREPLDIDSRLTKSQVALAAISDSVFTNPRLRSNARHARH